jgi:hypothetical protein
MIAPPIDNIPDLTVHEWTRRHEQRMEALSAIFGNLKATHKRLNRRGKDWRRTLGASMSDERKSPYRVRRDAVRRGPRTEAA